MNDRLLRLGVALGCVVLTFAFLVAGFPYDRLEQRVIRSFERSTGGRVVYAQASHLLTWAGPALEWQGVQVTGATAQPLAFERVRARLAWSLEWLRLAPAFHVDLQATPGHLAGVVSVGRVPGFDGRLEDYPLADLPERWAWQGARLSGVVDADIDVSSDGDRLEGDVRFDVRNGSLAGGRFRDGLPFESLTGEIELGGDRWAEIASLKIDGPLLRADVKGTIGAAASFDAAPLDLDVQLDAKPLATQILLGFGVRLKQTGPITLKIAGTTAQPVAR